MIEVDELEAFMRAEKELRELGLQFYNRTTGCAITLFEASLLVKISPQNIACRRIDLKSGKAKNENNNK